MPPISVNQTVWVWKFVLDREYSAKGKVEKTQIDQFGRQLVYVAGDWWVNENDLEHQCQVIDSNSRREAGG